MQTYLEILEKCLSNGTKSANRTGINTIRLPSGAQFQHDMSQGFPLLTTKQMPPKVIFTELEMFLKGITDKRWLQDRDCHIWDEWSNKHAWVPIFEEQRKQYIQKHGVISQKTEKGIKETAMEWCRDLGPIYGWQWRHWGANYVFNPDEPLANFDSKNPGIDQLQRVIDTAKNDPTDRRMVVNAWNPLYEEQMALPPCHYSWQILIHNGKLNLSWNQRSCDMFLGIPFNIASYAMLLLLLSKELGYEPGTLTGNLADVHIYENHISQVKEQLKRSPKELPTINIPNKSWNGILNWSATPNEGYEIKNYNPYGKLTGGVAR